MAVNPPQQKVDRAIHPKPASVHRLSLAYINALLLWAESNGASDIAFQTGDVIWMRLHGEWSTITEQKLQGSEIEELLAGMANEDSAPTQVRSGKADYDFAYEVNEGRTRRHRYRCNATACRAGKVTGIAMVIRTIPGEPPALDSMEPEPGLLKGLFPKNGLVLVTGPVGSGKTTLLAATLREILTTPPGRHVITYESPIEFDLSAIPNRCGMIVQSDIPLHLPGFEHAPRNSLRRAGDVVLYGETRDAVTIRNMTIQAETGVSVYATVHTNSVAETIPRMVREFPHQERHSMQATLLAAMRMIVHQRLLIDTQGGRVAVREFLVFDDAIREELLQTPPEQFITTCHRLVIQHGQTLISDIGRRHVEKRISDNDFAQLAAIYLQNNQDAGDSE